MLGFEPTATGWRATDEQVAWWQSRDTCPSCGEVVDAVRRTSDGLFAYRHDCNGVVEWTMGNPDADMKAYADFVNMGHEQDTPEMREYLASLEEPLTLDYMRNDGEYEFADEGEYGEDA